MVFGAIRFAPLVVLTAECSDKADSATEATLDNALQAFARRYPEPPRLLEALFRMPAGEVFEIVMIRMAAGTNASSLEEQSSRAARFFRHVVASKAPVARLVWNGIPPWFGKHLDCRATNCGWDYASRQRFVDMQSTRPPLYLRINHPQRSLEVEHELRERGWEPRVDGSTVLLAADDPAVRSTNAYRSGLVEVQDLASQLIGAEVEAQPGQFVWDCCCGAGGKTVQIAATACGPTHIFASDKREHMLEEVRSRLARAGFGNVEVFSWDATRSLSAADTTLPTDGFDWALIDAPCSGSGTWRRSPDARLRLDQCKLNRFTSLQRRLLDTVAGQIAPNGRLVYATCSWLCEENERIVTAFLKRRSDFRLRGQTLHGCPYHDSDTTYTAVFKRCCAPEA